MYVCVCVYREVSQEFLSGSWQYWSNLCALFCFLACEHFYRQGFLKGEKIVICVSTWKKSWEITGIDITTISLSLVLLIAH